MERFIVASLLLLLASAAAVDGRMGRAVFDDDTPRDRVLIGGDEVATACNQVHFRTMCRRLTKLPGVATPRQLLLASIRVASDRAKDAKIRVAEYAARTHASGPMKSITDTCREGYDNVLQSLEETRQLIEAKGTRFDLNSKVSDAATHADECNDAFADFPDIKSPFAAMQQNVYRLVNNVLNLAVVVQHAEAHQAKLPVGPHVH
ncbi:hypothetical protein GQ55_3G185300 [Panicum hallii var. hallii]|uniref:Pectinesterase inhibitor domain-containing protein n=1 Tax=Panicum hallii var. hallii TaxID=1504633 RepID=A0A2T7EAW0_9POAL|nr:hypothetical protein GQ55_3G185300 [Panicum hallii var. hallii]